MSAVLPASVDALPAPVEATRAPPREKLKLGVFLLVNGMLGAGIVGALALDADAETGLATYVSLLGLCCTLPLLFVKSMRGRAALLVLFQGIFFALFGLGDFASLVFGLHPRRTADGLLTGGEIAVLLTSLCFTAGYTAVVGLAPRGLRGVMARDWSPRAIGSMGVVFWLIGFALTVMLTAGNDFRHATSTGFAMFGGYAGVAILLTYLEPVGDMCMIYLYARWKSRGALAGMLFMFACEFALGFLSSAKELAFRGIVLFLISMLFLRGKVPVRALIIGFVLAILSFSFFQDMRTQVARQGRMDLAAIWEKLLSNPQKTFGSDNALDTRLQRGAEYFASRGNLKTSVELAVAHTGANVPFQNGHTLEPLLYTFVPRAWMPDKPGDKLGLLFNKEFHISIVRTVYIAAGQNGELYWNFGWEGLVLGMLLMGALVGALNVACDLRQSLTLPRFLMIMLAAYLLAFRFEAGIADQWSLMLRASALMLLIHAIMPKVRAAQA